MKLDQYSFEHRHTQRILSWWSRKLICMIFKHLEGKKTTTHDIRSLYLQYTSHRRSYTRNIYAQKKRKLAHLKKTKMLSPGG